MIYVGHVKKDDAPREARRWYCGRPTPLGNPFSHKDDTLAEFKTQSRDEAVRKYDEWLQECIKNKNRAICDTLNQIYRIAKTEDIVLLCWCHPKACHCDVIKRVIDEKLEQCRKL